MQTFTKSRFAPARALILTTERSGKSARRASSENTVSPFHATRIAPPAPTWRSNDCARALDDERLAYRVQNAWLDEQGRTERFGGMLHVLRCAAAQVDADGRMRLRRGGGSDGDAEALIGDLMRRRSLTPPETAPPPPGTAP